MVLWQCCGNQQKYGFGWRGLIRGFMTGGFIEQWTGGWNNWAVVGKIFQQKESNFLVGFVSKPPIYKHQSMLCFFFPTSMAETSYSWGFTSILVHSIATWLPKMQVLQIGMTNWPILTWWRGSSSWMPSVPRGKKNVVKKRHGWWINKRTGWKKKQHKREKGSDRYPFYHVLSMFSKDPKDPPMEGFERTCMYSRVSNVTSSKWRQFWGSNDP